MGIFIEACTTGIGQRLAIEIAARWLRYRRAIRYPARRAFSDLMFSNQFGTPPEGLLDSRSRRFPLSRARLALT